MNFFSNKEAIKAIYIGFLCTVSYLGCYFARNILGVVTPQMLDENILTIESIGAMSTGFMILYAAGQLVNGRIGDIIKTKYMVSVGIVFAGICNIIIAMTDSPTAAIFVYSLSGLFLSMIYAPIMKVVAENTLPVYASRCSLGFVVASFLGTPLASVMAIFFSWKLVFIICGFSLILIGIVAFLAFSALEKKGVIRFGRAIKDKKGSFDLKLLINRSIIRFSVIAILTGIIRTSVVFWIPTYLTDYLSLTPEAAAAIFTVMTLLKSASPYLNTLIMYEMVFKRNINATIFFMFLTSAISFLCIYFIDNTVINMVFMTLALLSSAGASTMLFSVYCPSLYDTGMVSTATGFLDCMSYLGAAVANFLFANAISTIGWGNLILVWAGLMAVGVFTGISKIRLHT
ncbi:MAG: MFS transporter [Clostridia bacterium]|nr:MFS transporter [Clostridia bacterium]